MPCGWKPIHCRFLLWPPHRQNLFPLALVSLKLVTGTAAHFMVPGPWANSKFKQRHLVCLNAAWVTEISVRAECLFSLRGTKAKQSTIHTCRRSLRPKCYTAIQPYKQKLNGLTDKSKLAQNQKKEIWKELQPRMTTQKVERVKLPANVGFPGRRTTSFRPSLHYAKTSLNDTTQLPLSVFCHQSCETMKHVRSSLGPVQQTVFLLFSDGECAKRYFLGMPQQNQNITNTNQHNTGFCNLQKCIC